MRPRESVTTPSCGIGELVLLYVAECGAHVLSGDSGVAVPPGGPSGQAGHLESPGAGSVAGLIGKSVAGRFSCDYVRNGVS